MTKFKNRIKKAYRILKTRWRVAFGKEPLSYGWGADRGYPVHRYYLECFLRDCKEDVKGHCLEFYNKDYTRKYGGQRVTRMDVMSKEPDNPEATIIADLCQPNLLESDTFDCIICTHVLHVIEDFKKAVQEMHRILKPGGVLLVAVPHISMCDPNFGELWRFTPYGLKRVMESAFQKEKVIIKGYGNSLAAACDLRGIVTHEMGVHELAFQDERFAVEVCGRAVKG